ncbi:MAG TPA: class I SAM-dependent methyltransferase [Puia sp.]|jgi:ubiquinone/menaquinone biosynthesis C-methylase UbiE|nr:class I SAM-dependent methyltransferase [Puia sp.]
MKLSEAISLIKHDRISKRARSTWADLGCGSGLFTQALGNLLADGSKIYAIDKNAEALRSIPAAGNIALEKIQANFNRDDLNLYQLDGILMANSLHFVKDKTSLLNKLKSYLKDEGSFLIIEYDLETPNPWVPYPVSYHSLQPLFENSGRYSFSKINEVPSKYNRSSIYSVLIEPNFTSHKR